MNRRAFLSNAILAASALAVDTERLLWTPGAKRIFIPPAPKEYWFYGSLSEHGRVEWASVWTRLLRPEEIEKLASVGTGLTYNEMMAQAADLGVGLSL